MEFQSYSALQCHRIPAEGSLPLLMDLLAQPRLQDFTSAGPAPSKRPGELRLQGGCNSKMASHFTQERDGKEGAKMSRAPTFFLITDLSSVPEIVPTRRCLVFTDGIK